MARRATKARSRTTRGWARSTPRTRDARRKLWKRCGARAFLLPNRGNPGLSKFPIVAQGSSGCVPNCQGLRSAKARAMQIASIVQRAGYPQDAVRYRAVAHRADLIGRRGSCRWA